MLVSFDESQVRKLCRDCKKVLDYLAISEVIETMEDLVQFVKDLSPCLSKVSHDIDARSKDLLNPYQRDTLNHHLDQIKTLAPILICSMKIFIQILGHQDGKGIDEAVENRNYLARRMTEEINEITRALEEPGKSETGMDGTYNKVNNVNARQADFTFHEVVKKLNQFLSSSHQIDHSAIKHMVELGMKIAEGFDGHVKAEIIDATNELDRLSTSNSPDARKRLSKTLAKLETTINEAVINRIIHDMADITTPLKQFTDAVASNDNDIARKRQLVEHRGQNLKLFSNRLSRTASVVAYANARNKRRSDTLHMLSTQVQNLTPQLINAGTIKMNYPENKAAEENFENLSKHYAEGIQSIRDLCDESIDVRTFLQQTLQHVKKSVNICEEAIKNRQTQIVVDNSALAARLANRLLMALYKESDNSDDPNLKRQVDSTGHKLKSVITPFVENSRAVAGSPGDAGLIQAWKMASNKLLEMVSLATRLFDELNMYGLDSSRDVNDGVTHNHVPVPEIPPPIPPPPSDLVEVPPPRPPLPEEARMPARPPAPPDTDDEEGLFAHEPGSDRPIRVAAHGLYQEVKQVKSVLNPLLEMY